ncbi:hydrogenase iron-sulfur subunit [Archaeoglobus neptunius]|uniref:hydrogenase iron-sulfur subunit n=1 Tax=Archaeoglobus neptunius TaxID=2798580 RepID=UPI00192814AF|nr:hydrogenase iron-sulfur subunit [Archaeoglobus neptunius]
MPEPKILIFAAEMAYRAADQAGLMKAWYPVATYIVRIPCTSMLRPELIIYAFEKGFDGVFVASSGPDCPFLGESCVGKTSQRIEKAYELMKGRGIEPERLLMSGVCSTCVETLVGKTKEFKETLSRLGPVKR